MNDFSELDIPFIFQQLLYGVDWQRWDTYPSVDVNASLLHTMVEMNRDSQTMVEMNHGGQTMVEMNHGGQTIVEMNHDGQTMVEMNHDGQIMVERAMMVRQ